MQKRKKKSKIFIKPPERGAIFSLVEGVYIMGKKSRMITSPKFKKKFASKFASLRNNLANTIEEIAETVKEVIEVKQPDIVTEPEPAKATVTQEVILEKPVEEEKKKVVKKTRTKRTRKKPQPKKTTEE